LVLWGIWTNQFEKHELSKERMVDFETREVN